MNALRRQNIRPQQIFERWTPRTQESPHELARQSEAKGKQAPQSEANVCRRRRKCNLNNAQNTQHKLGLAFSYLERNNAPAGTLLHHRNTLAIFLISVLDGSTIYNS